MRNDPRNIERVRRVLLAILSNGRLQGRPDDIPLAAEEWAMVGTAARQHRLEPLLHGIMRTAGGYWQVPTELRSDWREAHRLSALGSLAARGTLLRAARVLDSAGLAYAALKGAWLAWHAYDDPAQRPMRDIDILVSPAHLEAAYRALVANGFEEHTGEAFSAETLTLGKKHLPALRDRSTGIHVEVHSRLFEHIEPARGDAWLARSDDLLAARIWQPLGSVRIAYLPPCETLLHLLIHSAYEHRFDNGPQVLHDVAAVLKQGPIDWGRLWRLADEGGWTRGCELVLHLTEWLLGPQPIVWSPQPLPEGILEQAALMLLQDPEMRRDLDVQLQLGDLSAGSMSGLRWLAGRLLPGRRVVADFAGVPPDRRSAWLHYPAWLASRLARTASGRFDRLQRSEAARAHAIESWLAAR